MPTPVFKPGDVIKVPFPYVDKPVRQYRPALVVSSIAVNDGPGLLWVLMITSAKNRSWPGDLEIADLEKAGLPAASVVRCAKIATIESSSATRIGEIESAKYEDIRAILRKNLNL
jgi:mRNA interferase MazF